MDLSSLLGGDGGRSSNNRAGMDPPVSSSALTSLLNGAATGASTGAGTSTTNNDSTQQALLRALAATAVGGQQQQQQQQQPPPAPAPPPPSRGVSRSNSNVAAALSALMSDAPPDENALRTLLLLQSQTAVAPPAPAPAPPAPSTNPLADLQGLARLRGAPGLESLLASAAAAAASAPPAPLPPQPAALSNLGGGLDLLRLRAAISSNPAAGSGTDLLEQARLIHAINAHQQALASVGEAERRLTMLLSGGAGASVLGGSPPAAAATVASAPPSAGLPDAPATGAAAAASLLDNKPQATRPNSDADKLAFLEQLGSTKTCQPCLPPVEEGNTPHYSQRIIVPLGMEEDANWLSERQCFIRSELLEVVRASHEEVLVRSSSKSIAYQQVGIRCRYCAHLPAGSRAIRASAFPSSIRQMYQSFTMMVRDHFGNCVGVPPEKKQRFLKLKGLTSPSSSLSRQYWSFAAKKLGMKDSEYGIMINEETQAAAQKIPPFGTSPQETAAIQAAKVELMVEERDQNSISPYLYFLMSQAQMVSLIPSERVGKRKDAAVGLPGFGCTHCAKAGRLGFCRMFPLNKRSLPDKVNDLYNHMIRCPMCPRMTKRLLESRRTEQEGNRVFAERDRDFIDRIWIKLGRDVDEAFKKP